MCVFLALLLRREEVTKEVKGVFVRLPLSEEQKAAVYDLTSKGGATDAILTIGTPVTGGNLDCAVIIEQDDKRYMPEVVSYQPHLVKPKQLLNLVRQSDAQAKIAALEAEVVRLQGLLERFRDTVIAGTTQSQTIRGDSFPIGSHHHPIWVEIADALKGGAA